MNIVHVGYNISLSEELLELLNSKFKDHEFPSQVPLATLHKQSEHWRNWRNDTNATASEMKQWFEKAKSGTAYLTMLYCKSKSRNPPKNTKFDIIIVAKVMIDGKPYYVNIFNNSSIPPIEVKKYLCTNEKAFEKIDIARMELSCTPYLHEQN